MSSSRLERAIRKKAKIRTLRNIVGKFLAKHACTAGVQPSAVYGSDVNGLSCKELLSLQSGGGGYGACHLVAFANGIKVNHW